MQVIILAAGIGKRLQPITNDVPKVMVKVGGKEIIIHQLELVSKLDDVSEIIIVVGYKKELVKRLIGNKFNGIKIRYVENIKYKSTNNNYSLFLALRYVKEAILLLEGDVLFKEELLKKITRGDRNIVFVEKFKSYMDGSVVEIDKSSAVIKQLIQKKDQGENFNYENFYKTVNIYYFTKKFVKKTYYPSLKVYINSYGKKDYYELVIGSLIYLNVCKLYAEVLKEPMLWLEIDDVVDLTFAEYFFLKKDLSFIEEKYGGYWDFDFIDYCYLYNLYFPSSKLIKEIVRDAKVLINAYPSGQKYLKLLISSFFDFKINTQNIFIGNGASELIKIINKTLIDSVTIISPNFGEYFDLNKKIISEFKLKESEEFKIDFDKLILQARKTSFLVLTNPNNPTGKAISRREVIFLLNSLKELKGIILDESFIDFSNQKSCMDLVEKYKNLIYIKSISKSYGVAGLRLGFLYTQNELVKKTLITHLPIWNINSFAEKFLEKFSKYKNEFISSLSLIKADRKKLGRQLNKINNLKAYSSEANYILCKIKKKNMNAKELSQRLFINDKIFIKDLSNKMGDAFFRITVRTNEDNRKLIASLKKYLS